MASKAIIKLSSVKPDSLASDFSPGLCGCGMLISDEDLFLAVAAAGLPDHGLRGGDLS